MTRSTINFTSLDTSIEGLVLRPLTKEDAALLFDLIQTSKAHLTRNGDYQDLVQMNVKQIQENIQNPNGDEFMLGIALRKVLIGTVTVIQHQETVFGLGYWIGEKYAGNGYMIEAVGAIINLVTKQMGATEFWAGIKPNNYASIALVKHLDFGLAREQTAHHSYRLNV